eukprot:gene24477-29583_t
MKQHARPSVSSAKDLVKQLKLQKQQALAASKPASSEPARANKLPVIAAKPASSASFPSAASSSLPANFFDSEPTAAPVANPSVVTNASKLSSSVRMAPATASAPNPAPQASSAIPAGFFDDPLLDMKTRGIDINKVAKELENKEKVEVEAFLSEIEGLGGDENPYDDTHVEISDLFVASAKKRKVDEDDLLQAAYMAKLVHLLQKSDELVAKKGQLSQNDELSSIIQEAERITEVMVGEAAKERKDTMEVAFKQAMSRIVKRREERKEHLDELPSKQQIGAKRSREETDDDSDGCSSDDHDDVVDYSPLDFF